MAHISRPSQRWPWKTPERAGRATSHEPHERVRRRARLTALARRGLDGLRRLAHQLAHHDHAHPGSHADIARSRLGVLAALGSAAPLALVLVAELAIYTTSDSVALLADAVHNLGDILTALPVAAAILAHSHGWERRTGRLVALVVFGSALYAGCEAIARFIAPNDAHHTAALAAAAVIGILGNWVAAETRARVGHRINSPALIADAQHARADAILSVGVLLSASATWLGAPILDPIIGLTVST